MSQLEWGSVKFRREFFKKKKESFHKYLISANTKEYTPNSINRNVTESDSSFTHRNKINMTGSF